MSTNRDSIVMTKSKTWPYLGILALFSTLFSFPIVLGFFTQQGTVENLTLSSFELPFINKIEGNKAYIYFGYVGCSSICPTALERMDKNDENTMVYFVNLIPGLDDKQVQNYVDAFGTKNTVGIQANEQDLIHIETIFSNFKNGRIGVYNPELHTDQVFLIEKNANSWVLTHRYNNTISLRSS